MSVIEELKQYLNAEISKQSKSNKKIRIEYEINLAYMKIGTWITVLGEIEELEAREKKNETNS